MAALAFTSLQAADGDKPGPPPGKDKPRGEWKHGPREGGPDHRRGPGDRGGFHRPGGDFGPMAMLNLTEDQKARVKEIFEANRPKIEAIRQEEQQKIRLIMEESQKQMRTVLTPEQLQVFDEAQKLREDERKLRESARKLRAERDASGKQE